MQWECMRQDFFTGKENNVGTWLCYCLGGIPSVVQKALLFARVVYRNKRGS
jgi:hypothetical protein